MPSRLSIPISFPPPYPLVGMTFGLLSHLFTADKLFCLRILLVNVFCLMIPFLVFLSLRVVCHHFATAEPMNHCLYARLFNIASASQQIRLSCCQCCHSQLVCLSLWYLCQRWHTSLDTRFSWAKSCRDELMVSKPAPLCLSCFIYSHTTLFFSHSSFYHSWPRLTFFKSHFPFFSHFTASKFFPILTSSDFSEHPFAMPFFNVRQSKSVRDVRRSVVVAVAVVFF